MSMASRKSELLGILETSRLPPGVLRRQVVLLANGGWVVNFTIKGKCGRFVDNAEFIPDAEWHAAKDAIYSQLTIDQRAELQWDTCVAIGPNDKLIVKPN